MQVPDPKEKGRGGADFVRRFLTVPGARVPEARVPESPKAVYMLKGASIS